MRLPSGLYVDQPSSPLMQAGISYFDVTTANGNALGTTLVCAGLANEPSYQNFHAVKMISGDAAGQVRPIATHIAGTPTIAVTAPFTDSAGVVVQIVAGTRFVVLSFGAGGLGDILEMLMRPRVSFVETWQDELGIDATVWTWTDPATGTAWNRGAAGAYLRATSVPNANEVARLRSVQRWIAAPDTYNTNTILRKMLWEFELRLANVANMDNALTLFGLTTGVADTRATNNIIGFGLLADVLQSITDNAGAETVNTGFGETLANWNKLRVEIYQANVDFYINEALVAEHQANLPDFPMYMQYFVDTEAGGAATFELGVNRVWYEDIRR